MTRKAQILLALGGLIAMASGMGLGRFLYTPVLPMMAEAGLGPAEAGFLASANFAGYLLGALAATLPGLTPRAWTWLIGALGVSAVTTGAMGLTGDFWAWVALRFVGGWASAFILVFTTTVVAARLRAAGGALAYSHFAGVGAGIAASALISAPMLAADSAWRQVWLTGGGLMLAALVAVLALVPRTAPPVSAPVSATGPPRAGLWRLVLAYGCLGFGYVITATFIVAMLREGPGGREAEALVWLIVGLTGVPSVWVWERIAARIGPVGAYQAAMLIEAAGVALGALSTGPIALAVTAAALGATFIGLTALGLREAARRAGGDARAITAVMTASFGLGQMIGPALAGWMRGATGSFSAPSLIAAAVLAAGAVLVVPLRRQ